MQGGAGDLFVAGAYDDFVDPAHRGFPRLAETAGQAGQVLQFKRDVFHDVAGPGAFFQALQETAALAVAAAVFDQRRQPAGQAVIEAGNDVRRKVFQFSDVDPDLQRGAIGPDIGAVQRQDTEKFYIFHE